MATQSDIQILYTTPPQDFVSGIEVVACYIEYIDKILFLKRSPLKPEGGTWCVPGGKREQKETLIESMQRELEEETGIVLSESRIQYFRETYLRYPNLDIVYHLFRANIQYLPTIKLNEAEHQAYCFVTRLESQKLTLIPGADEALNLLYGE